MRGSANSRSAESRVSPFIAWDQHEISELPQPQPVLVRVPPVLPCGLASGFGPRLAPTVSEHHILQRRSSDRAEVAQRVADRDDGIGMGVGW
jgi:hypothetical protein